MNEHQFMLTVVENDKETLLVITEYKEDGTKVQHPVEKPGVNKDEATMKTIDAYLDLYGTFTTEERQKAQKTIIDKLEWHKYVARAHDQLKTMKIAAGIPENKGEGK